MKKNIPILFLIVSAFSCNMSDSVEELTGEYTFVHEGETHNFIVGKHTIYADVIDYSYDDNYILACQIPNKEMYLSQLQSSLWSDYFCYNSYLKDSTSEKFNKSRNEILKDSVISKVFKNRKVSFQNTSEDIKKGEEIADSIIKNNPFHKKVFSLKKVYWIIEIKNNLLIGPLSKDEYDLKRKELKLSEEFKLKN
jgi:hypothetical protein